MNLIGEKVILRAIEERDLEFLQEIINDPKMENMVVGWSFPVSKTQQAKWYEAQESNTNSMKFAIEFEEKIIGVATLDNIDWKNRSVGHGVKLGSDAPKGEGLGTDTVNAIMKYAFKELQLNRMYGSILEYNIPSQKLYEKCGWIKEGIARKSVFKNNQYHNEILVSILREDYDKLYNKEN